MIEGLQRFGRRVRLVIRRAAAERSMDDELQHHLQCETDERMRDGMSREAARQAARAAFGNLQAIKELARDARGIRPLEDVSSDVRFGTRQLVRQPAYAIAAILTLALATGAVIAIYSVVYGILLRPLPYDNPDRLAVVWERNVPRDRDENVVSLENYEAWRERATSFAGMSALVPAHVTLQGEPIAERLSGADVTAGYFTLLGVQPAIGRDFDANDARSGTSVILSDRLWRRCFGSDPGIVGRAVVLSRRPFTVVGVMPATFEAPRVGWLGEQELWFPFVATPESRSWGRFLIVVARLGDGVSHHAAGVEMAAIAAQRARESPANRDWSATVKPLDEQITGGVKTSLLVLMAAVMLLLMMAIANVATLSLAMVGGRAQELAVRSAIGATDRRIFRHLFVQSAVLGVAGALAGTMVAVPGIRVLLALLPADVPRASSIAVDLPVLLAAFVLTVAVSVLLGTLAARRGCRIARVSPLTSIAAGSRATGRIGGGALVIGEISLAVALGVMALLMVRSFTSLRAVDLGFESDGVLALRVALPSAGYPSPERQRAFFEALTARVEQLPTVLSSGIISSRPLGGVGPATIARDAAQPPAPAGQDPVVDVRYADGGVFTALGMTIEAGAPFDAREARREEPRVIISSSLARQLWPDRDPVGRRLAIEMYNGITPTVAAVVNDIHLKDPRTPPRPTAYLSTLRYPSSVADLIVKVTRDPEATVPSLRAAAAGIDPSVPLYSVTTLPRVVDATLATDRLTASLLAAFAGLALLLATVGVVGVFAGDVNRRRKEIGVRLALGAVNGSIVRLLLAASMRHAMIGLALGWLVALVLGRAMESLLFGVGPSDPVSFAAVGVLAVVLAVGATALPAWHALRSSPLRSLREQ